MDTPLPTYEETVANEDPLVAVPKRPSPSPPTAPPPPYSPTAPSPTASAPVPTGNDPDSASSSLLQDVFEPVGPPPEPDHHETRLQRYHRLTRFDKAEMDSLEWRFESEPYYAVHCASPVFDLWITISRELKSEVDEKRARYNGERNDRLYVVLEDRVPYFKTKEMIAVVTRGGRWRVNWLLHQMSTSQ